MCSLIWGWGLKKEMWGRRVIALVFCVKRKTKGSKAHSGSLFEV